MTSVTIDNREMLRLQYFYNKSQVVNCYWFKFETNTKITFFAPTITTSNNVVNISFLIENKYL